MSFSKPLIITIIVFIVGWQLTSNTKADKHLFILSGQSNMARLDPSISFIPTLELAFGKENIKVVKDAQGAQPIRRWYKNWRAVNGDMPKETGDLYKRLMKKVQVALEVQSYDTVTFIWMQGERDARENHGDVYAKSLNGLIMQLSDDIARPDLNFIIGRLSDFGIANKNYPHWTKVRAAQVAVTKGNSHAAWVNTDDLNDGVNNKGKYVKNDLHMSVEGYKILGKRFAQQSINLIQKAK